MRIGFWAEDANKKIESGLHIATSNILRHLLKLDRINDYCLILAKPPTDYISGFKRNSIRFSLFKDINEMRLWGGLLRKIKIIDECNSFSLGRHLNRLKIDIFCAIGHIIPPLNFSGKQIYWVHDLAHILFPQTLTSQMKKILAKSVDLKIRRANMIITRSKFTKQEIIDNYGVSEKKIEVIYGGIDRTLYYPDTNDKVFAQLKTRFGIKGRYFIFFGEIQPRKNLIRIINAFEEVKRRLKDPALQLILVGRKGWMYEEILEKASRSEFNQDIIFTGSLQVNILRVLLNNAICLVFTTLYEGFGMPPLEAMACACAVIVSNSSSFPEIVGDAGVKVDPYHEEEIAEAMIKISEDRSLRESLIDKGLERVKLFSCEKAIEKLLEIFKYV